MENVKTDIIFPINSEEQGLLMERAAVIHKSNKQIEDLINKQRRIISSLYTLTEEFGDKRKFLFEIPFSAVTFYNLDDKAGYEKGTYINYPILNIYSIRVYYTEYFKSGTGYGIDTGLRMYFVWNNLHKGQSPEKDVWGYHYANFDDKNLCFSKNFFFQTEEQYLSFKEIYSSLEKLAKKMGLSL